MHQLIIGQDEDVAAWAFVTYSMALCRYDAAVGIVDDGRLVGAALWHAYSGHDIELSYYGPMTRGIAKSLAKMAIDYFGVSRVTARPFMETN